MNLIPLKDPFSPHVFLVFLAESHGLVMEDKTEQFQIPLNLILFRHI